MDNRQASVNVVAQRHREVDVKALTCQPVHQGSVEMPVGGLLGQNGLFMENLLALRQKRQEIIAANVANADTPGYKAKRLEFEQSLADALPRTGELPMARTDPKHMPAPLQFPMTGTVLATEIPIPKGDLNSVDLEQEMARQSANQILHTYAIQAIGGQIDKLRMVIDGIE